MADLKSLAAAAGSVKTADGKDIAVRGISLVDLGHLTREHGRDLMSAFDTFKDLDSSEESNATATLHKLIDRVPALVGEVIALATDSPGGGEDAQHLPLGLQIAILNEIGRQTFVMEGGLGKTLEIVINMAAETTQAIADLQTPKA